MINPSILELIKGLRKDATTTGISTGTGLNFYNLEAQAKNIYPVFYPLLASIPRKNPMFNGQRVGGLGINWKAITGIDAGGYPAVSEGNRNAYLNFTEKDYYAPYKFLGKDVEVSFQAQATGLGFDDNVSLAQLSQLNALLMGEERMILFGNSGTPGVGGTYGFVLGTVSAPVALGVTTVVDAKGGTGFPNAVNVSAFCVALTAWGQYLATPTGVKLPFRRVNADSSTDDINGGTSVVSAASAVVASSSGTSKQSVQFTVNPIAGAVAYAWFVDTTDATTPVTSNAVFWGLSSTSTVVISGAPPGTNQKANATDAVTTKGLSTDNSYNTLDFDGLMTWGFSNANASQPSYWKDLAGAGFTANGDGTIKEFEDVMDFFWLNYKLTFDKIYVGGNLISAISRAIVQSSTGHSLAQRIVFDRNSDGTLSGGTKLVEYRSKYSNTGAPKVLPVLTHPWMPQGCIYFDLINNPYPAAGGTIPTVRQIMSLEDHFSIKWPYRKLQHELGTYCFETLQHYIPFGIAVITGAANVVNP
jgi:hypothetical protein